MNFSKRILTDANTSKANAKETSLKLIEGYITQVQIFFPEGHKGLTYCIIYDGEIQIFPTNLGEPYSGASIEFKTNYKITKPWELKIKTWNLDTLKEHNIIIRVTLLTEKPLTKEIIIKERRSGFLDNLIKWWDNL